MTNPDNASGASDETSESKPTIVNLSVESAFHGHRAQTVKLTIVMPWEQLCITAEQLLMSGFPEVAVVVAMTACETIVARAMTVAFARKNVPELQGPVFKFVRPFAIGAENNDRLRELYKALTGDDQITHPNFWENIKSATKARNEVVHKGGRISKADARKYIDAAKCLVEHVAAANQLPLTGE